MSSGERHAQYEHMLTSGKVSKIVLQSASAFGEVRVFSNPKSASCEAKSSLPTLSTLSETKALGSAKSQASSKAKAFFSAKSQASGEIKALFSANFKPATLCTASQC